MANPDDSTNNSRSSSSDNVSSPNGNRLSGDGEGMATRITRHLAAKKIDSLLWVTRIFTLVCTIMFIIPLFGVNPSLYHRILISNAATSALRLHQRLPAVQFSMNFLRLLLAEDSFHYLMFSVIFLTANPVTMATIPVFIFAVMHASSFTRGTLNVIGPRSFMFLHSLITKLQSKQVQMFRFIALSEICLLPAVVFMATTGRMHLLHIFIYYKFLTLRYASRRNPYCRTLFYELRMTVQHVCSSHRCPQFIRTVCYKIISVVSRLAPTAPGTQ